MLINKKKYDKKYIKYKIKGNLRKVKTYLNNEIIY